MSDLNRVGFYFTSGTYANPTGTTLQNFGLVQSHEPDETVNIEQVRYTGADSLNVGQQVTTSKDYTGTLTYYPQDFKTFWFAMGSVADTSGTISTHNIRDTNSDDGNAFVSGTCGDIIDFNVYDAHRCNPTGGNWIRQFNGATIDSLTINGTEGGILSCDLSYTAQSVTDTSGASASITPSSSRPFVFSDCILELPSGTSVDEMTNFTFSVTNEYKKRHYGNGSEVIAEPKRLKREYSFEFSIDENTTHRKTFYEQYFQGGSEFNCMLQIGTANNRKAYLIMSGCRLSDDSVNTPNEGANEESITIIPQTCAINVSDTVASYTAW